MEPDWVRNIQRQCLKAEIAFFFKQWGGIRKSQTGRILDGMTFSEFPKRQQIDPPSLQIRREKLDFLET
jgi:protein gp37